MRAIMLGALVLGLVAACGRPFDDSAHRLRPLVDVAAQRMLLADDLAADKRATGAPVEDLARERVVLDAAVARGRELGLDAVVVRVVVGDQIRASKAVQNGLLQRWSADAAVVADTTDTVDTRLTLDLLIDALLVELSRASADLAAPGCPASVDRARIAVAQDRGLDMLHADALGLAVASLCRR